jgi:hypothetical protein
MVRFDKDIVEDPLDDLDSVHAPNESREGPVHTLLSRLMSEEQGGSYHNTDPKRGHLSASDSCQRKNYLNYVHKLDDNLDVPPNDNETNWTFSHGDAIHELIQDMLVEYLGKGHVTKEETVSYDINEDYYIYGHADLVLRGLDSVVELNNALPVDVAFDPDETKGFPDPFVIDIKTKSEFKYYNYGKNGHARTVPKESNLMQLNGYMGILGAQYGCLLYYSKRNDYIEEYWVEFDEELFEKAKENIELVLNSVNTGTPAPRNPDGEYMCEKFCKWYKQGKCPGMEGVDPHENWDGDDEAFVYDHPEWA